MIAVESVETVATKYHAQSVISSPLLQVRASTIQVWVLGAKSSTKSEVKVESQSVQSDP